jgi:SAM-dependent methyltransferase
VIPVLNQHEMTFNCLDTIREATSGDYEIILVDNGSDPPIAKHYMGFVDVTLIRNETNLGFPVAVNQGVRASKGDAIVLLNNDVFVTPGWAERLMAHLYRFSVIGPMTNYCAGKQRITLPAYEDRASLFEIASEYADGLAGQATEANWIIGFCFAFRRMLFDEIGEFDESMWPCSGEEIDFCYRARQKGHLVGIARDVYVHHEGSVTFKDLEREGTCDYGATCDATSDALKKKWGDDFWRKQVVRGVESSEGLRLNLGCGRFPLAGFVNIDQDMDVNPDLTCSILSLPYEAGTVDEIYVGHCLEHFDYRDGEAALAYWFHLLRPGGQISISVPDFDVLATEYARNPSPTKLREFNDLYIYSYRQKSPHKYAYSEGLLREVMTTAGFLDLERMPVNHRYFPYPVTWQVGIQGVKP